MSERSGRLDPRVGPWFIPAIACVALGGVRPWAVIAVLVLCALGTLRGRRLRLGLPELLALGALAVQLLQLVPLPMGLLGVLDPTTAALVQDSWVAAGRTPAAHPLSLAPGETAFASAQLALFVLALALARREATHDRADLLVQGVVIAAAGVVAVVLLHAATGLDAIYGVVPARGQGISVVIGPFVSSNHLAVFCAAVLPVIAARTLIAEGLLARVNGAVLGIALAAIALATLSRTAVLGLVLGLGLLAVFLVASRQVRLRAMLVGVGAALFSVAAGVVATSGRVKALVDLEFLGDASSRTGLWQLAGDVARDHWIGGVGAGAFHSLWWTVRAGPSETSAQDTESVLVQTAVSLGLPATLALLAGTAWVLWSAARVARRRAREGDAGPAGAFAGLLALLAMNGVTLATSQPGIAIVGAWLLGSLLEREDSGRRLPRWAPAAFAGCAILLVLWGAPRTLQGTDAVFAADTVDDPIAIALRHPTDPYGFCWAATRSPDRGVELLNRAMVLDPHGAEPHRIAVNVLLRAGLRSQARIEARLALAGATRRELPGFVADALELWPKADDRLALLPLEPERARRVAEAMTVHDATLGRAAWLSLGRRLDPVPGALARGLALFPAADRVEALALSRTGLLDSPDDVALQIQHARLLQANGLAKEAGAVLDATAARPDLTPRQRAETAWQLGRLYAEEPVRLRGLLEHPLGDTVPERAVKAWIQGRVHEADGHRSQALRAYTQAAQLRPDVQFFRDEVVRYRSTAVAP